MDDTKDEVLLVASIIDRLLQSQGTVRADQLTPLTKRLREVAERIASSGGTADSASAPGAVSISKTGRNADGSAGVNRLLKLQNASRVTFPNSRSQNAARAKGTSKVPSSGNPWGAVGSDKIHISSEVAQSLCCSLYNTLEGAVNLLRASEGHIFVKNGDDMAAIANVSRRLVFPPQQVHHRCIGSADAEVLGSSIALNRHVGDTDKSGSVLIFPIFANARAAASKRVPVATIHIERRDRMLEPFTNIDECILHFASVFCGELMSRAPHFDWLDAFYDPATQHIVAPFEPCTPVRLPSIQKLPRVSGNGAAVAVKGNVADPTHMAAQVQDKIATHDAKILIRRESLPSRGTKSFAPGITHMPTLLEIQAYVDNLQSCWKKNMSENVDLLEEDRNTQQSLKLARSELVATRRRLAAANEKLRLYELSSKDYKHEYSTLKAELNAYMDGLDNFR